MATISDSNGDERQQRIAELKRKMQENASRVKAEQAAKEGGSEKVVKAVAQVAAPVAASAPVAEAVSTPVAEVAAAPVVASNGAAVAAPKPAPVVAAKPAAPKAAPAPKMEEATASSAGISRREFITYAWGAALGLLTVETALMSYFFMYPRFKAGQFGGKFFLPPTEVPPLDAAPKGETAGKFWLVSTEEGPKAIYMVCTHLGCLYKWEPSNNRFECPCHGSKFSKDGFYIEGPAPRSLDSFVLTEENGQVVVDTGKKITGNPAGESPARVTVA